MVLPCHQFHHFGERRVSHRECPAGTSRYVCNWLVDSPETRRQHWKNNDTWHHSGLKPYHRMVSIRLFPPHHFPVKATHQGSKRIVSQAVRRHCVSVNPVPRDFSEDVLWLGFRAGWCLGMAWLPPTQRRSSALRYRGLRVTGCSSLPPPAASGLPMLWNLLQW